MFRFDGPIGIIIMIKRIKKAVEDLPRMRPIMASLKHIMRLLRETEKRRYPYFCLSLR